MKHREAAAVPVQSLPVRFYYSLHVATMHEKGMKGDYLQWLLHSEQMGRAKN